MDKSNILNDDLNIMKFLGKVVDVNDPERKGRIKVSVYGKFDDLPIDAIPYASPCTNFTGGSETGGGFLSIPKLNSDVNVVFDNGNIYYPLYLNLQEINQDLIANIETDDDYINIHSLIYDSTNKLKVWYLKSKGLLLELDNTFINIKNDNSIVLSSDGGKQIHIKKDAISLGKLDKSDEPAVLGDKNVKALTELLDKIDNICDKLITFSTTQTTVTSGVYIFAPLTAAFTKLTADISAIKATLPITKNNTIPQTRSKSVSLDGPSLT